ncbi:MAG: tRNA 5-methylaminomethyl-2-thiouridine biosynthesis bifunctional protein [Oceanicaulis sp. HLUCCA04]|nr:MAG: tRNA 5-methylaminomethyl-2-thiouridine biosynthesis bifunctional protein [Oceanicaulis sp. HLUCCA04]
MSDSLVRPFASLDWSEPGTPRASGGDVYFSAEDGLAETRAVFLAGCRLEERFAGGGTTILGELGFGTGLNFLSAWQLFDETAPANARLHFVSLEGFPLSLADARRALSAFDELADKAGALASQWPPPLKGPHRRVFAGGRVTLTVFHDTVEAALAQMDFAADAWFLDGFAPALNGEMWSADVFAHLARLSKAGARLGTFTVAGAVRRGLADAGFAVEKVPGFGRKRERLEGVFKGSAATAPPAPPGSVAIIGGGIAAASLVKALSWRGKRPCVIAKGGWGAGASGGPAALFTPRLEAADRPHVRATLNAFEYARALYDGLDGFHGSGVVRAASAHDGAERLKRIAAMMAGAGIVAQDTGLLLERAGWVEPSRLLPALAGDVPVMDARAARIAPLVTGGWQVSDGEGRVLADADQLILASGADALPEGADMYLPADVLPGQIARFAYDSPPIHRPVAWGHYLATLPDGTLLAGATHERGERLTPDEAAEEIRAAVSAFDAGIGAVLGAVLEHWGAARCVLPDRLPAAGQAVRADGSAIAGLHLLTGFGARGFAHAPLLAEHLISVMCGEPSALERAGAASLDPARFALRALRRKGNSPRR